MIKVHLLSVVIGLGLGLAINFAEWGAWIMKSTSTNTTSHDSSNSTSTLGESLNTTNDTRIVEEENPSWKSWPPFDDSLPALKQYNSAGRSLQIQESLTRAQRGGGTFIFSDFITNSDTLQQLADPDLWTECANRENNTWLDFGAKPRAVWDELAVHMWQHHPAVIAASAFTANDSSDSIEHAFVGYEYWCNILVPEFPLGWHVDKDEQLHNPIIEYLTEDNVDERADDGRIVKNPYMGAVYYGYPHRCEGGYLEVLPRQDGKTVTVPREYYNKATTTEVERIEPLYNRLIWFNASNWHRVAPVKRGARFTFAANLWKETPLGFGHSKSPSSIDPVGNQA